jgi:hypothetical protein
MTDPPADVSVLGADVVGAALADGETEGAADGDAEADALAELSCGESCVDGDTCASALSTWSTLSVRTGVVLMP